MADGSAGLRDREGVGIAVGPGVVVPTVHPGSDLPVPRSHGWLLPTGLALALLALVGGLLLGNLVRDRSTVDTHT